MKKNTILIILLVIACCFFFSTSILAYTQKDQSAFTQKTADGTGLTRAEYADIVSMVINIILGVAGAIFVALIVYGGFIWITSTGNPEKIGQAKKILKYAIIGIIFVAAGYTISYFIVSALESTASV